MQSARHQVVELALALVEHRHDRTLDDLLEVRRLAVRRQRRFVGVLLALPASALLMVGFRHLRRHYLRSSFYNA